MIAMLAMKILVRTVKVMMMATSHRSAETMDSLEDGPAPPLEGTRSERQIPRSRCVEEVQVEQGGQGEEEMHGVEEVRGEQGVHGEHERGWRRSKYGSSSTISTVYYGLTSHLMDRYVDIDIDT